MSKRKRGAPRDYLGHKMTRADQSAIASLIGMTMLADGVSKNKIKSENEIWDYMRAVFGWSPHPVDGFVKNVRSARAFLKRMTADERQAARVAAGKQIARPPVTRHVRTAKTPSVKVKDAFYKSWEWRTLRMEVIKEFGRECQCCGAAPGMKTSAGDPVRICVDHIKPISKFWELRLVRSNLQILCDECNQGKGNWDQTDFRNPDAPDEWLIEDDGIDPALVMQLTDRTTGQLH